MTYVSIYRTAHYSEISIIRNLLDEKGIEYQVPDEVTNSATGVGGLGINGMRVMVREEQKEEAMALLKDRGFS